MEYEDPDLQEPSALAAARRTRKYLRRSTNVAVHGPRLLRVQAAAGGHEARVGRWPERCSFLFQALTTRQPLAPPPEHSTGFNLQKRGTSARRLSRRSPKYHARVTTPAVKFPTL